MAEFIYFARDTGCGLIKIGYSRKPAKRIAGLSYELKRPVRLLAVARGSRRTERHLHDLFIEDRYEGEWFFPSPALDALVDFVKTWPVSTCGIGSGTAPILQEAVS